MLQDSASCNCATGVNGALICEVRQCAVCTNSVVYGASCLHNATHHISQRLSHDNECGHWEVDLMGTRSKAQGMVMIDRYSRYTFLHKLPSKHAKHLYYGIRFILRTFPYSLSQSFTFDRGSENALYQLLDTERRSHSYFCNPHSPWEKGLVENTIGLLRHYLPKGTSFTSRCSREAQSNTIRVK